MTPIHKNLKIVCVKFIGKIRGTLVADLAYGIVHQFFEPCDGKGFT